MAQAVFLDTSCLVAMLVPSDALHGACKRVFAKLEATRSRLVTSQWVLAEFLNGSSSPRIRVRAIELVNRLVYSPICTVVEADSAWFLGAMDLFTARPDQEWGLVDCASM